MVLLLLLLSFCRHGTVIPLMHVQIDSNEFALAVVAVDNLWGRCGAWRWKKKFCFWDRQRTYGGWGEDEGHFRFWRRFVVLCTIRSVKINLAAAPTRWSWFPPVKAKFTSVVISLNRSNTVNLIQCMSRNGKRISLVWVVCLVLCFPLWNRTTSVPKSVPRGWFG